MNRAVEQGVSGRRAGALDIARIRADFPVLAQTVHGRPLVYLDNAATTQKPAAVIDAIAHYYRCDNANVHRAVHTLGERATQSYEGARARVRAFVNASSEREIVFVRGATEGINLVAATWGQANVGAGDEIVITAMEHHSNIVPWQLLCERTGARLRVAPINAAGELEIEELEALLNERTRLVAVSHCSNALGTINPVKRIAERAHAAGSLVLVDGAQAAPHLPVDVRDLDCDFYVFSGHKLYGPTGIGVLYGKQALLEAMPPYQGGGDMIRTVSFERSTWNELPYKFEAGTPHIAGAVGLGAAIEYVRAIGLDAIAAHEHALLEYATALLAEVPGLRLIGTARDKAAIVSFTLENVHPHDIGTVLDHEGVAIRAGHHCAMPLMQRFVLPATARASIGLYNTREDIDSLAQGIMRTRELFG